MGQPAARIGDMHTCPMVTPGTPPIPHVGGPVVSGSANVLTGKIPQGRVTDKCVCVGPPDVIVKGSATVLVNNLPAARMGDMTAHGGVIVKGEITVLIGDAAGGGGGGGGGAMLMPLMLEGGDALANAMAKAMIGAAKEGKPFCEQCTRAALAAAAH